MVSGLRSSSPPAPSARKKAPIWSTSSRMTALVSSCVSGRPCAIRPAWIAISCRIASAMLSAEGVNVRVFPFGAVTSISRTTTITLRLSFDRLVASLGDVQP